MNGVDVGVGGFKLEETQHAWGEVAKSMMHLHVQMTDLKMNFENVSWQLSPPGLWAHDSRRRK